MSEIKNGMLGLYDAEHSKFDHMRTLRFKGLTCVDILLLKLRIKSPTDFLRSPEVRPCLKSKT